MWLHEVKKPFVNIVSCIAAALVAAVLQPEAAAEIKSLKNGNGPAAVSVNTGWSLYSWGLYYKNQALRIKNRSEREPLLKKAVQYFNDAAASGGPMDKIYYQLSECFFYRNDNALSLDYARKSLAFNNSDLRPYNRIYNIYIKLRNYEAAAGILEDFIKVKPDSVQVLFLLAEHYSRNMNNMDRATATYRKVIALSDQLPVEDYYKEQSYFNLASIAYWKGDLEQAVAMFNEVLNINKDNPDAIFYLALTSMEMYDLSEAERYSIQFLEKRPGDPVINSVLGRVYYLRDDIRAIGHLGAAKNTGSLSGILAWGLYCELLRKDEMAEKLLGGVLKYSPKTISVHLALARINARKNNTSVAFNEYVTSGVLMYNSKLYEESKRSFIEASKLNGDVPGVYYYLGKVYEDTQQVSLSLYYYLKANSLQPDLDLMLHIGYLYGVKKEYPSAMKYFNMASAKEPANARPYFFKGLVSIWQEDYAMAERNIQRAISLDEKSETYYFYLAIVMEKMSKLDMAINSLEKAIKYNPKSARAYNYLGYLYADNNMKIDESLNLIQKALELEPGNGAYTDSLGWVYFRKGNYKLALEKLLAAEELLRKANSPDPVVYDHIGDAFLKLGKLDSALRYWNKSNDMKKTDAVESKLKKYQNNK
jgi:tetratricopeptide (TPR) repeat protein